MHCCVIVGHFGRVCQNSKRRQQSQVNVIQSQAVVTRPANQEPDDYVYTIHEYQPQRDQVVIVCSNKLPLCTIQLNTTPIEFMIDSGTSVNILDGKAYQQLCQSHPSTPLQPPQTQIYPCGSPKPLPVTVENLGILHITREIASKVSTAQIVPEVFKQYRQDTWKTSEATNFYIISGNGGNLLSFTIAENLGILHITREIASKVSTAQIVSNFPEVFKQYRQDTWKPSEATLHG